MALVDVVVPCHNYANYLRQCVESILIQSEVDVRILIIDDASSDETPDTAARLAAADHRVSVRTHAINRGHIETYNEGLLEWASSAYSLLISADDVLAPGALSRAVAIMERHPEVGMTYGMARTFTDDQATAELPMERSADYQIISGEAFLRLCFAPMNPVPTPAAVVRTSVQKQIGGYSRDLPHTSDMEMWMRFATCGPIAVTRATQAFYRIHGVNMSTHYNSRSLGDLQGRLDACSAIYERCRSTLPDARSWLSTARRGASAEALDAATASFDRGDLRDARRCAEFAAAMDPSIRNTGAWRKHRLKSVLGYRTWKRIQPTLDRRRGAPAAPSGSSIDRWLGYAGQEIGWWPDRRPTQLSDSAR